MVVATGFFDGVHAGHRLVLNRLVETARARGGQSLVVTFWPHPRNVLQSDASSLRLLTSLDEKKELILGLGVDRIEVIEFTKEFSLLTAEEYFRDYVAARFGGDTVVLGYDNRVGCDCRNVEEAMQAAERTGLEVIVADRLASDTGTAVSSTWIRAMIEAGEMETAAGMLGYSYRLTGVVVSGEHLGKMMGFPTANMELYEPLKIIPGNGAYLVRVSASGGQYYGMCNIGNRPTVREGNSRTIETHIFGFDEDIYGLDISISFVRKIRNEIRFGSMAALKEQLSKDRNFCMDLIRSEYGER